jgi:hypothetical protein
LTQVSIPTEEDAMTKLLGVLVAVATLGVAAPASAQLYLGAGPGGVGVQVGPLGAGIGPAWTPDRHYYYHDDTYALADCRIVRERVVTPSGRMVIRSRRECY